MDNKQTPIDIEIVQKEFERVILKAMSHLGERTKDLTLFRSIGDASLDSSKRKKHVA